MKYIAFLVGLSLCLSCATRNKLIKRTTKLEENGRYEEALNSYTKKLGKKRNIKTDEVVERVGYKYFDDVMDKAEIANDNARTPEEHEKAAQRCENAKLQLRKYNTLYGYELLRWKDEYQDACQFLNTITTESFYREAVELYQQQNYELAYNRLTEVTRRDKTYKETARIMKECNEAIAEKYYLLGQKSYYAQDYQEAYDYFYKTLERAATYKDAKYLQTVCYDKVTEQKYAKAMELYKIKDYEKAENMFQLVDKRQSNYKETTKHIKLCYDAITEQYYNKGLQQYASKQYKEAEKEFKTVANRTNDYKEVQDYLVKCYDAITEVIYQNGISYYNSNQYTKAEGEFNTVNTRKSNYKEATNYIRKCYDGITKEQYEEANKLYTNRQYKKAYTELSNLKSRTRITELYPNLDTQLQSCIDKGGIRIYIEGYNELSNQVYSRLTNQVSDRFLKFVGNAAEANHTIVLTTDYQATGANPSKQNRTAYKIRTFTQVVNTITTTMYEAIEPVAYTAISGNKRFVGTGNYTIRGTSKRGDFTATTTDNINAYEYTGNIPLNQISLTSVPANSSGITTAQYSTYFKERTTFLSDNEMKNQLKEKMIQEFNTRITEDIKELLNEMQ